MQRFGWVTTAKPEEIDEYLRLHADPWPGVLDMIKQCNIENYSIFHKTLPTGEHFLFGYFEYAGNDFEADMQKMAADEETQRWWSVCKPCLEPIEKLSPGEVWSAMDQVFFMQ